MKAHTIDGHEVEITHDEIRRLAGMLGMSAAHNAAVPLPFREWPAGKAGTYAEKTREIMLSAMNELREETGDLPEDLKELYEFAAKHELFGDREDTHIMMNFLKLFYCLMQKETHTITE